MADSPGQATSSKGQEASLKACRSSSDRISSLPDALIHRILSFLPTKEAVATSVLSKRWVSLWTLVPTLDFQDSYRCGYSEEAKMKFVCFVYRVLLLNKAGSVEKFRLNCKSVHDYSCVSTWICSVTDRGLQEVDISIPFSEIVKGDFKLKLPSGLFLMKTLKILKLHGGIMIDVPVSVCFPSLKILHLIKVKYANAESIRCFISGCPSLEELHIDARIKPENTVNLIISTPTLNRLLLALHYDFNHQPKMKINAPALKFLNFSSFDFEPIQNFVENSPSLIEANISVPGCYRTKPLRALRGVKCLELNGRLDTARNTLTTISLFQFFSVLQTSYLVQYNISGWLLILLSNLILRGNMGPGRTYFPIFVNLTQLELRAGFMHGDGATATCWVVVSLFLQNSPRLKTLVVHDKIFTRWREWKLPELVPVCFEVSLTRACFEFEGLEEELKMAEYFLKNAIVLRTMEIYTRGLSSDSKLCFLQKLSMFPRSSENCQLLFI